jgi:hypothetical protein
MDDEHPYPQFESDFQWFMHGGFNYVLDEDWERYYAQLNKHKPTRCMHGKTEMTCEICYFQK